MSWAAHEFENYLLQKKFTRDGWVTPSFLAIVIGTLAPDMFTKAFAYGAHGNAAQVDRGWPGLGFSHSFIFGVFLAVVVLWLTRNRGWAIGVALGQFAHVITDIGDTAGVMPFFPFSTENVTIRLWTYSAVAGTYGDGAAYYSGPGALWDLGWLLLALLVAWRALTATYFREVIMPADPGACTPVSTPSCHSSRCGADRPSSRAPTSRTPGSSRLPSVPLSPAHCSLASSPCAGACSSGTCGSEARADLRRISP